MTRKQTLYQCIDATKLSDAQKSALKDEIEELGYDSQDASVRFSDSQMRDLIDEHLQEKITQAKRVQYRNLKQFDRLVEIENITNQIIEIGAQRGVDSPVHKLIRAFMDPDPEGFGSELGVRAIPIETNAILADAARELGPVYDRFREAMFGRVRDYEGQMELMRRIHEQDFSGDMGDLAKKTADAIESLRRQYNDAGGFLPHRRGYTFPTPHNATAMVRMGKEAWIRLFKKAKMVMYDPVTGQPFRGEALDQALDMVWDNVTQGRRHEPALLYRIEGKELTSAQYQARLDTLRDKVDEAAGTERTKIENEIKMLEEARPTSIMGSNMQANQPIYNLRGQERLIDFPEFEGWRTYLEEMGSDDPFALLHQNLEDLSREVAMMRAFGPDSDKGLEFALQKAAYAEPDAKAGTGIFGKNKLKGKLISPRAMLRADWGVVTGRINEGGGDTLVKGAGILRNIATGTFLGKAVVSALAGDPLTVSITSAFNGTGGMKALRRYISGTVKPNEATLVHLGVHTAGLVSGWRTMQRYTEVEEAMGRSARYADLMTRVSLLQHVTKQGDKVFPTLMLEKIAQELPQKWDNLPDGMRGFFQRYNIGEQDWDKIRQARDAMVYIDRNGGLTREKRGAPLFMMNDLDKVLPEDEAANMRRKLIYAINAENEFALLKGSTRARAITTGGTAANNIASMAWRGILQFSTHPITIINRHLARAIAEGKQGRYGYWAQLAIGSAMAGAVIVQTKELLAGRDPQAMFDTDEPDKSVKFWGDAVASGGGFGFYFDLVTALAEGEEGVQSRFGGGASLRLLGEAVGLTAGTVKNIVMSDSPWETEVAKAVSDAEGLSPATTHFATIVANKMLFDAMASWFDRSYVERSNRRMMRYYEREQGQRFWWRPGEATPQRAPDLGRAIEGD